MGNSRRPRAEMSKSLAQKFCTSVACASVLLIPATSLRAQSGEEVRRNAQLFELDARFGANYRAYPEQRFDLDQLPPYLPKRKVSGWIKIHGANTLAQGRLAQLWEAGFRSFHPEARFSFYLPAAEVALTPLYYHQADISLVHELGFYDILPYERVLNSQPLRIAAFTGSLDLRGYAPAFKIIVGKDNPLTSITMEQLDGIFGAQRDGGWIGTAWRADLSRGKDRNIRSWGQLGLDGAWANKPIHLHGYSARDPIAVAFNDRVMRGGDKWNEDLLAYGPYIDSDGAAVSAERQLVSAVAADKFAIAFTAGAPASSMVKELRIARSSADEPVRPDAASVQARQYPLFREAALFVNLRPSGQLEPMVEEFLRYVLSREAQVEVQRDGKYLPLNLSALAEQRALLDRALQKVSATDVAARRSATTDGEAALRTQALRAIAIAKRGAAPRYPANQFDLADLPLYRPKAILTGWIRIHGLNYIETARLRKFWEEAFAKLQPGIKISWFLPTSAVGYASLYYNTADLLLGAERGLGDSLAYEKIMGRKPFAIESHTGSFDLPGWANTPVIIVNSKNPLARISMQQLDGVFGSQRKGGWRGTAWHPEFARGPDKNIRTWGQLGLKGTWANKPIHVYGFNLRYNTSEAFSDRVLQGSDKWNEDIVTTGNYATADGRRVVGGDFIARAVANDPYAIAYTNFSEEYRQAGNKVLDLAEKNDGPYIAPSIENSRNRSYPMLNVNAFFMNETPGTPMNPLVKEFLSFILSREGQAEVQRDGKHLPLTAELIARERTKLERAWGDEP